MKEYLQHYRGYENLVKRTEDLIHQLRRGRNTSSFFLTPDEQEIVESICGNQIEYRKDGGYPDAQSVRYEFIDNPYEVTELTQQLKASYDSRYGELSHRDVLGAIMNLGLRRDQFGDMLVDDKCIYIFTVPEIADYVIDELRKIGRYSLVFEYNDDEIKHTAKMSIETKIITNMRLDSIVASCANISRTKAQQLIKSGLVKVDYKVLEESSELCNNGNTISIRGHGRFLLMDTKSKTKKDRLVIEIAKYE